MNSRTVRYEHRLIRPFHYNYYGHGTLPVGLVVLKSKSPHKCEYYLVTMGHGWKEKISGEYVRVYEITRTVEETEIALPEIS